DYEPGESTTDLFGGNSNWRGPIWLPVNFLIIQALREYYRYYGSSFQVECPTGSGQMKTLEQVAVELSRRVARIFIRNEQGKRPVFGESEMFNNDSNWKDFIPFYEYFHGDTGRGCGASHQTGWTGLIAQILVSLHEATRDHEFCRVAIVRTFSFMPAVVTVSQHGAPPSCRKPTPTICVRPLRFLLFHSICR